jgi:hypothetical protein
MFRSLREKALGAAGVLSLALFLPVGVASAGTVNVHCDCEADNNAKDCDGEPYQWCRCVESQGLNALATNQYNRYCNNPNNPVSYRPQSLCQSGPEYLVGSLPSNVTCTHPEGVNDGVYQYNQCTNWNFKSKHFNVYTYCTG